MDEWQHDLSDSAWEFIHQVWPVIGPKLGGGELISNELETSDRMARLFDKHGGIDAWQFRADRGLRAIASRVQWIEKGQAPWKTFTIRKTRHSGTRTEWEKLRMALDDKDGWIRPHLMIHAYLTLPRRQGMLLAAAAARISDIVSQIVLTGVRTRTAPDGNTLTFVKWTEMIHKDVPILTVDPVCATLTPKQTQTALPFSVVQSSTSTTATGILRADQLTWRW